MSRTALLAVTIVAAAAGALRCFLNVCRHRGSILLDGQGTRSTIQCPYHAWTYDLDGSLRRAPRAEREQGFETERLGLVPLAVDTWGPLVFVNPDPEAAPLAETLGELPALVESAGIDLDALEFRLHERDELSHPLVGGVGREEVVEEAERAARSVRDQRADTEVRPPGLDVELGVRPQEVKLAATPRSGSRIASWSRASSAESRPASSRRDGSSPGASA